MNGSKTLKKDEKESVNKSVSKTKPKTPIYI